MEDSGEAEFTTNDRPPRMQILLRFRFYFSLVTLVTILMVSSLDSFSQSVSQFQLDSSGQDLEYHASALEQANLEPYRLQDEDRILRFDDGVEFSLRSAQGLIANGAALDIEGYAKASDVDKAITLIFNIAPNGQLGYYTEIDTQSKLARIGQGYPSGLKRTITQSEFDQLSEGKQAYILANPDKYVIR